MAIWEDLLGNIQVLDELAQQVQEPNEVPNVIDQLRTQYIIWYGECLAILPSDLAEKFRGYVDKSNNAPNIQSFLESPNLKHTIPSGFAVAGRIGSPPAPPASRPQYIAHPYKTYFADLLMAQKLILVEASKRPAQPSYSFRAIETVEHLARNFSSFARSLRDRREGRPPIIINDEYDLQYLLYGLLRLFFKDFREEEPTPSFGGGSSHIDFFLKDEQVAVEMNLASSSLKDKAVSKQPIDDIARYQINDTCKSLVCFVYDPNHNINNLSTVEELSGRHDNLDVLVIVSPQ